MTEHCRRCEERLVTVRDVEAVVREHLTKLDALWPDTERYGCRKVHIVELLDSIKLALYQRGDKNATSHISAFERAARKITGYDPSAGTQAGSQTPPAGPTSQESLAALRGRIKRNT